MLSRTSCHICGRWYLPMFLLRDGLLTLMYYASFIALLRFWSSLPTMLKLSMVTLWPVALKWSYIQEGALWCSLNLSPNALEDSPIYSSSHSTLTPVSINDLTLLLDKILIFWSHQEVLDGIASFKIHLHSMFTAYFLQALTQPFVVMVPPCMVSGCCCFGQSWWYLFYICCCFGVEILQF